MKLYDRVVSVGYLQISADGRSVTESYWVPAAQRKKAVLVYQYIASAWTPVASIPGEHGVSAGCDGQPGLPVGSSATRTKVGIRGAARTAVRVARFPGLEPRTHI
jgi:hypothetical protein